jgi:signal transduction histidine kinase
LAVIFEKFGRGHGAVAQSTPGAGLGLYVSQQIVRAHGQELMVQSASGSGTTFSFSLQVAT